MADRVGPSWAQVRRTLGALSGQFRRVAEADYPGDENAQNAFVHGAFEGYLHGLRKAEPPTE